MKEELLKLLQKEAEKSPKAFKVYSYEDGYWEGLKFAAFLIRGYKPKKKK